MKTVLAVACFVLLVGCYREAAESAHPPAPGSRPGAKGDVAQADRAAVSENTDQVFDVGEQVTAPRRLNQCSPSTERLREITAGREITQPRFIYEIVVSANGEVTSVALKRSSQSGEPYDALEREFRRAFGQCRFAPGERNGKPVAVRLMMIGTVEVR